MQTTQHQQQRVEYENQYEVEIGHYFAQRHKSAGNDYMTCKKYGAALHQYSKAIKISPSSDFSFYSNRCMVYLKLRLFMDLALNDAITSIEMIDKMPVENTGEEKALIQRLKCKNLIWRCLYEMGRYTDIIQQADSVLTALRSYPQNAQIARWRKNFELVFQTASISIKEWRLFTANGKQRRDFVREFEQCDELIEMILSFCDPLDLLTCGSVCKEWKSIVDDNHFWRRLCQQRWEGKQTIEFNQVCKEESRAINNGQQYSWKRKYWTVEHDAARTKLTEEELTKINWKFYMGHRGAAPMDAKFKPDHTFVSSMGMLMKWRLIEFGYRIQVEEYPQLVISRDKSTWAFILRNDYVKFVSHSFDK